MKTLTIVLGAAYLALAGSLAVAADKPTDPQIAHIAYSADGQDEGQSTASSPSSVRCTVGQV